MVINQKILIKHIFLGRGRKPSILAEGFATKRTRENPVSIVKELEYDSEHFCLPLVKFLIKDATVN